MTRPQRSFSSRLIGRARREFHFAKTYVMPHGPGELWRSLIDFKAPDEVLSKRVAKGLFPKFVHPLSHRAIPRDQKLESRFLRYCIGNFDRSRAQFLQDTMVLFFLEEKRNGYFVEFGATNGVDLSNSYQLETQWGWTGILAEPARCWHPALERNRRCAVDFRCVWSKSGELLEFSEATNADLSTIAPLAGGGIHNASRDTRHTYQVETISLEDLLASHGAPRDIDFVSADTEGSEWDILDAFDFGKRKVSILAVEHNYDAARRQKIHDLLHRHGFIRVLEELSLYDDWYVERSLVERALAR